MTDDHFSMIKTLDLKLKRLKDKMISKTVF